MCKDIVSVRKSRRSGNGGTQEFFTPQSLADRMFDKLPDDMFTDFTKTYCDTCAGNGNLVLTFLNSRLKKCKSDTDIIDAVSTIYAVELMQDNVDEMKQRIISACEERYRELYSGNVQYLFSLVEVLDDIIDHNIVCSDFFKWDFDNWCSKSEEDLLLF